MKTAPWFCAAIIAITPAALLSDERPTADELLTAYEKSVEQFSRARMERKQKGPPRGGYDFEWTIFRDGPRWKVDKWFVPNGNRPGPNGNRPAAKRSREQTLIGNEIVTLTLRYDPPDDQPRIGILSANLERVASRSWVRLGPVGVLFGRMTGDAGLPLWTIMRESGSLELLPKTEIIDGVETYVLRSRGKYGEHKVWLDPASGRLPRRIEIEKVSGNLLDEQQLGTAPAPNTAAPPKQAPPVRAPVMQLTRGFSTRIDKVKIEKKEGLFVITGYEEEGGITTADGKAATRKRTEIQFQVVEVNPQKFPENAFRFDVEIPNGTIVAVTDNDPPGYQGPVKTEHEWVDGKIRERAAK